MAETDPVDGAHELRGVLCVVCVAPVFYMHPSLSLVWHFQAFRLEPPRLAREREARTPADAVVVHKTRDSEPADDRRVLDFFGRERTAFHHGCFHPLQRTCENSQTTPEELVISTTPPLVTYVPSCLCPVEAHEHEREPRITFTMRRPAIRTIKFSQKPV